ncbi:MAG: hypothetical protein NT045_07310 [Candidatus Aureabacteria bacterium]|nr:hypothetical protein [Candidatus Auribacterota bacterium]
MQVVRRFHKKVCSFKKQEVKVNYEGVRERGNPNVNWQPIECLNMTEECVGAQCRFTKRPGASKSYTN